jgi:hypothetical protein
MHGKNRGFPKLTHDLLGFKENVCAFQSSDLEFNICAFGPCTIMERLT